MRTRLTALTLGLYLSFVLLGCNKPAAPADSSSSSSTTAAPASSDNTTSSAAPSGGSAMSSTAMSMKPEAPRPLVVPAGTVLTVRLGQAVGSKISSAGETFTATLASGNGARPNSDVLDVTGMAPATFAEFAAKTAPAWN